MGRKRKGRKTGYAKNHCPVNTRRPELPPVFVFNGPVTITTPPADPGPAVPARPPGCLGWHQRAAVTLAPWVRLWLAAGCPLPPWV